MRKADNTIIFGSQSAEAKPAGPAAEAKPAGSSAPPPTVPVRTRLLADDLVDDRTYFGRSERGLVFAAISLALVGVAAAGTFFFLGSREPVVSTTTTTSAEVPATSTSASAPAPAPIATPSDQPWDAPEVDAVRAPGLSKPKLAKELPGPQLLPTERPPAAPPPTTYATKIEGAKPAPTAKRVPSNEPPPGMSDEALERAGFYGNLLPKPVVPDDDAGSTTNPNPEPEGKAPSAASTEEPSQFTPEPSEPAPSETLPDVKIRE